jgi:hypothetical protein
MRKRVAVIMVLTALLLAAVGCEAKLSVPTQSGAEEKGDAYFYDESSGTVLTDLSDNFDFKIQQWELHPDEETGLERLLFNVSIKNKTNTSLKNFNCDIQFDESMLYLFTPGLTNYDQNQPIDLIPDVTGNGASYAVDLSVNADKEIEKIGADKNDLLEKARYVTLKLSWDGEEETVLIICDELLAKESV